MYTRRVLVCHLVCSHDDILEVCGLEQVADSVPDNVILGAVQAVHMHPIHPRLDKQYGTVTCY